MLDQPPIAAGLTLSDIVQWLGAALLGVLLWVWHSLVGRVDDHDKELEALRVAHARTQERHDALVGIVQRIEKKLNELPGEIVDMLTTRRQQ